jgi:phospholipase/carboxylesterase
MKRRPWSSIRSEPWAARAAAVFVVACQASPGVKQSGAASASPAAAMPRPKSVALGLDYVEVMVGGARADDPAPMIVALHGLGDRPEHFVSIFDGFPARARVLAPHSRDAYSDGFAWFTPIGPMSDEAAPALAKAADEVAMFTEKAVRARPTLGKPLVVGFSQGGALSYAIAVRHTDSIGGAFPVGGWLPPPLWPAGRPSSELPIFAFHGNADERVPLSRDRAGAEQLEKLGFAVHFKEADGVGHAIPPSIRLPLFAALSTEAEKQRSLGSR